MYRIINGKNIAKEINEQLKDDIEKYFRRYKTYPKLSVIVVGKDPASQFYVKMMARSCEKASIQFEKHDIPHNISEEDLLKKIEKLNNDFTVSGIIIQLPLPKHINQSKIQESVNPFKDVDCFNPVNMGKLALANPEFFPCTPYAVYEIMKRENIIAEGKHTVILGRSSIVGKPLALILLQKEKYANATLTICHSRTKELAHFTRQADILITAVGRAEIIRHNMVKKGAIIIDVGTNEVNGKLIGDVAYDEVLEKVSAITPVPGGVGPVTNVMLIKNTLLAAKKLIVAKRK